MTWVALDDSAGDHPKQLEAGVDACWLWVRGLCYANRHHTDGLLKKSWLSNVAGGVWPPAKVKQLAAKLCEVKLWHDHGDHFEIHDYEDYQAPALKAEEEARRARKRGQRPETNDTDDAPEKASRLFFARVGERIKIGVSDNPWTRLKQLSRASADVEDLGWVRGSANDLRDIEERFAHVRLSGRGWFGADEELLNYILEMVATKDAKGAETSSPKQTKGRNETSNEKTNGSERNSDRNLAQGRAQAGAQAGAGGRDPVPIPSRPDRKEPPPPQPSATKSGAKEEEEREFEGDEDRDVRGARADRYELWGREYSKRYIKFNNVVGFAKVPKYAQHLRALTDWSLEAELTDEQCCTVLDRFFADRDTERVGDKHWIGYLVPRADEYLKGSSVGRSGPVPQHLRPLP